MVSAAKGVVNVGFYYSTIALDEHADFGDMEGSKIEWLGFYYSGGVGYSNWEGKPKRFENLITGISMSDGLRKSLKTLYIACCEITKEKAKEILKKYGLNNIDIEF